MAVHLLCVQPFSLAGKNFEKGQIVEDQTEINTLSLSHDHHFVRIGPTPEWLAKQAAAVEEPAAAPEAPAAAAGYAPTPAP